METLKRLFAALSLRQRLLIAAVSVAVVGLLAGLVHWSGERDFKVLYSGLAAEDAGAVMARLKELGIEYRVGDAGASLLVPSARVAEVRLQLAAAGLPKSGRIGYELFDKTNLGTTEFAEQLNYHRALEGELERSVSSLSEVEQARVHLTFPKESVFVDARQPAKASVMVKLRPGSRLSPQNVVAITHLAASAVEGLAPESVSVLDMRGNLLSRPRPVAQDGSGLPDELTEYRQRAERELLSKVSATLEPLLGADHFRAAVSVECDLTSGEQSEEVYDPARSVMTSSQRSEDTSATAAPSGVPGAASNLPRPLARPLGGAGAVSRRSESITYQSTRLVKRTKLPQGGVKKLSVAVLVDHRVRWQGTGATAKRIVEPPTPQSLKAIRDLVAGVTGLSPERGDQLVVETLAFASTLEASASGAATAPTSAPAAWESRAALLGAGVVLLVLLGALTWLLWRRQHRPPTVSVTAELPEGDSEGQPALEAGSTGPAALPAPGDAGLTIEDELAELQKHVTKTKRGEVIVRHFTEEAKKNPAVLVQVLRTWLDEPHR